MATINYKTAGVDIDAGNEAVHRLKSHVEKTFSPQVLTGIGSFGAMYDLKPIMEQYIHPIMVQSIDGVGTKMIVARMMQKFDTIGIDLVSATANDIVVLGAKPITLLDYIATDHLLPHNIEEIIKGMANSCLEQGISLVGGETAEMPDTYLKGEHDLVGIVTGIVEKDQAILGDTIKDGDIVLAFPSSGLHTNGYSLARKILFSLGGYTVESYISDLGQSLGEALLAPHINYTKPILHLIENHIKIKGMAHITGGGVLENIPRVLPDYCSVEINKKICPIPPIFDVLRALGDLEESELYRTFNMGIGMVLIVDPTEMSAIASLLKSYPQFPIFEIGRVISGNREVRLLS